MDPTTLGVIFIWLGIVCIATVLTTIIFKIIECLGRRAEYVAI
jgi:hypothetical protein